MPLDATRMIQNGHLIHQDVLQFIDLLTGVMVDQPVTLANVVTCENELHLNDFNLAGTYIDQATDGGFNIQTGNYTRWRVMGGGAPNAGGGALLPGYDAETDLGSTAYRVGNAYVAKDIFFGRQTTHQIQHFYGTGTPPMDTQVSTFSDPLLGWDGLLIQSIVDGFTPTQVTIAPDPRNTGGNLGAYVRMYNAFPVPANNSVPYASLGITFDGIAAITTQSEFSVFITTDVAWWSTSNVILDMGSGNPPYITLGYEGAARTEVMVNGWLDLQPVVPPNPPTPFTTQSNARLFVRSGDPAHVFNIDQTGTVHQFAYLTDITGGGGLTLPLGQNLTFAPDATYDIGPSGNQPNNITARGTIAAYGSLWSPTIGGDAVGLNIQTSGVTRWRIDGTTFAFLAAGDNTQDIGAPGASRPRSIYVGTSLLSPALSNPTAGGSLSFQTAGTPRWQLNSNGHLFPAVDNAYDVGATPSNRVRNLYVAGAFVGNGSVPTGGTANQVLTKNSATNYDLIWTTPSGGALSWPLLAPDGTVAAPSYSFASEPTLGIIRYSAGTLGIGQSAAYPTYPAVYVGVNGVAIGVSPNAWTAVGIAKVFTTNSSQYMIDMSGAQFSSSATSRMYCIYMRAQVATGATGSLGSMYGIYMVNPAVPATCTVQDIYGIYIQNLGTAQANNAYGVFIVGQSGAKYDNIGLSNGGTTQLVRNVTIGNLSPQAANGLLIYGNLTSGATQYFLSSQATGSSSGTAEITAIAAVAATAAAAFTVNNVVGVHILNIVVGAGSVINNAFGLTVDGITASTLNNYGVYVGTPSGGTTNQVIGSQSGGFLSTAGAWTNAGSWRASKAAITDVCDAELGRWFEWLASEHRPVRYRHPFVADAKGVAIGPYTEAKAYDHFGFLLDDVPQDIREVWCYDAGGALSTKDTEGFLLAMLKVSGQRIASLEARLAALEA